MIPKAEFYCLGFLSDASQRLSKIRLYFQERVAAARDAIYKHEAPIKGAFPELQLKAFSLVPTFNAFADALGPLGFNIYRALTVDLLHEFELGIFKSVFKHLLWLLHAINPIFGTNLVTTLDAQFHQIPSFGKGVIRQFPSNVSAACQCTAHHFEDVLQVGYVGD
ncbi:hypothetical protein SCLCIDRAFT_119251 [Scleroderma citrinum Foug A]|uniref:Uncharacterized protein n=1 Tax=Scleroderma citrinum Foug A TaxID=1036808 RepID=A0A0C2ZM53_9AGAM|nr:hypothetical protein SCLCIDRAFT_119251 [Scleroderma citrinum Foug A]